MNGFHVYIAFCALQHKTLLQAFKISSNGVKQEQEGMTKKRKLSISSPVKVEVKEENVLGNDYLMAKGRLKGVLRQLTENTDSESDYSDDNRSYRSRK